LKESLEKLWDYRYEGAMVNYLNRWIDQLKWQRLTPFGRQHVVCYSARRASRTVHQDQRARREETASVDREGKRPHRRGTGIRREARYRRRRRHDCKGEGAGASAPAWVGHL